MQLAALSPMLHASPRRRGGSTEWLAGTLYVRQGCCRALRGITASVFDLEGTKRQQLLPYPSLLPQPTDHP
jgi:hypothetical protein